MFFGIVSEILVQPGAGRDGEDHAARQLFVICKKHMSEEQKNLMNVMVEAALKGSEAMADDFTSWRKPIARAVFYFGTFIIMLLTLPIIIPYKMFRKKLIDPYSKMQIELETKWRTESSDAALLTLRGIYTKIRLHLNEVMMMGFRIEPYGKFRFYEYIKVSHLLYHWELQHQNWDQANIICDEILENYKNFDPHKSKTHAEWIVYKARIINRLEGNLTAQKYLLKYVDLEQEECPINSYLYELRKAS
jgi:hypothetical protein